MYEEEINTIRGELPAILAEKLSREDAAEYIYELMEKMGTLRNYGSDKQTYFRDTLMFATKLNRRFGTGAKCGNKILKMILNAFVENKNTKSVNQQETYSEPISSLSQLRSNEPSEPPNAKHIVFNTLLTELADLFDTRFDKVGAMKGAFVRNLAPLSVPIRTKSLLEKWAKNRSFTGTFNLVEEHEMRLTLDLLYTIFCDQWGPSVTDLLMAQAIDRVEEIPEAKKFPPQNIL